MNFKLINLISLLLLLTYQTVASVDIDEYFKNGIFNKIRKGKTSFLTDIEVVTIEDKNVNHIEEKYAFDLNVGEYVGQEKTKESSTRYTAKLLYLNDIAEIYQIDKRSKVCEPWPLDKPTLEFFVTNWAPNEVFNSTFKYPILGPNVLLFVLFDNYDKNKENITCEDEDEKNRKNYQKCSITFEDAVKVDYYFEDVGVNSMVPDKIIVSKKDELKSTEKEIVWANFRQFNYFKFTPSLLPSSVKSVVSTNLPIGYGCERSKNSKLYPKTITDYGNRFELEYEFVFEYPETKDNTKKPPIDGEFDKINLNELKQPQTPKDDEKDNEGGDKDDKDDKDNEGGDKDNKDEDKFKEPTKFLTEILFNKMYHDSKGSINVVETVNEFYGNPVRTIYDTNSHVLYDVSLNTDKCTSYHLTAEHNLNYYYVQDLFVNYPQFFSTEGQFEYIGQYDVRSIPCLVFEKKFDNYNKKYKSTGDAKNDLYLEMFRKNVNGLYSNHATVTHYYPTIKNYWSENSNQYEVPMKVEIRLFEDNSRTIQTGKLTLNVASFKHEAEDYEIFDVSKCAEHTYDYNWFLVKFDDTSKDVQKFKKFEAQMKNSFRIVLDISPLRIGEILIDNDENSFYITTKLMELAQVQGYFYSQSKTTIKEPSKEVFADNEELCARSCFSLKNCAAYSYCSKLDCKLWTDEKFDKGFNASKPIGEEYDWNRIKTDSSEDCTFNKRIVKYNPKNHLSNRQFLEQLDSKITNEKLNLTVVDEKYTDNLFKATSLKINVQPGRHTKSSSKLEDEKFDDERNHIKYNDLFTITNPNRVFKQDSVKEKTNKEGKSQLIASSGGLLLWECQLLCINNEECKSMSYCKGTNECILTGLSDFKEFDDYTAINPGCVTSAKNYLAMYHKHNKKGLVQKYKKIIQDKSEDDLSENICASLCDSDQDCYSFDYCSGEDLKKENDNKDGTGNPIYACYLHDKKSENDNSTDKQPEWDEDKTHCNHFTYKHTNEYNEYSTVKLKDTSIDIGTEDKISLEQCATICTESVKCNSFDYCIDQAKDGHIDTLRCRLSTDVYNKAKVQQKAFSCSTYSKINPVKIFRKIEVPKDNPVGGGLVTFLSFLFLFVGAALGAGAAYYVIKYYFVAY